MNKMKAKKLRKIWVKIEKKEPDHESKNKKDLLLPEEKKLWTKWLKVLKNKMKKYKSNNKTNNKKRNKLIAKNQNQLLFHKVKFLKIILVAVMLSKNLLIK